MKASFLRISGTLKELRIVASTAPLSLPYDSMIWQVPPAASIFSRAVFEKPWACTVSGLVSSPRREHLDRDALAGGQAGAAQRVEVDGGALVEAGLEVLEVHGLRVRAERLERHRHLLVRAAQLAHPHVDRVLAALEAGAVLGAGA